MWNKLLFILILVLILPLCLIHSAHASTIELKSGVTITGKIVEKSEFGITVEIEDGEQLPYMMAEVRSIDGKKVKHPDAVAEDSDEDSDNDSDSAHEKSEPIPLDQDVVDNSENAAQSTQENSDSMPLNRDDVLDTASMDFTAPYLWFYSKNGRVPLNDDIDHLKLIAGQLTPPVDLDKYTDLDFSLQPDGGLKIKYRLKSKSAGSEIILPKPSPK